MKTRRRALLRRPPTGQDRGLSPVPAHPSVVAPPPSPISPAASSSSGIGGGSSSNKAVREIHWEPPPPTTIPDPATPTSPSPDSTSTTATARATTTKTTKAGTARPHVNSSSASPPVSPAPPLLKTRRLLPPSFRVDDGEDMVRSSTATGTFHTAANAATTTSGGAGGASMTSPPKLVRQCRASRRPRGTATAKTTTTTRLHPRTTREVQQRTDSQTHGIPTSSGKEDPTEPPPSSSAAEEEEEGSLSTLAEARDSVPPQPLWESSRAASWASTLSPVQGTAAKVTTLYHQSPQQQQQQQQQNCYPRMESMRSVASRSLASHSTQAELDFYSRRMEQQQTAALAGGMAAPPLWIASSASSLSPLTSSRHHHPHHSPHSHGLTTTNAATTTVPSSSSFHQRRRHMLAQSVGMLRSHRPTWDRTESAHSFCSASIVSHNNNNTVASSSSSRKSIYSWTTAAATSTTATANYHHHHHHHTGDSACAASPPVHVRHTSGGSSVGPRPMITAAAVAGPWWAAHRPVAAPAVPLPRTTWPTTSSSPRLEDGYGHRVGHAGAVADHTHTMATTTTRMRQPSLLEADDDVMGEFWPSLSSLTMTGGGDKDCHDHENDGHRPIHHGGTLWEPHLGGSFMVYRRDG